LTYRNFLSFDGACPLCRLTDSYRKSVAKRIARFLPTAGS